MMKTKPKNGERAGPLIHGPTALDIERLAKRNGESPSAAMNRCVLLELNRLQAKATEGAMRIYDVLLKTVGDMKSTALKNGQQVECMALAIVADRLAGLRTNEMVRLPAELRERVESAMKEAYLDIPFEFLLRRTLEEELPYLENDHEEAEAMRYFWEGAK